MIEDTRSMPPRRYTEIEEDKLPSSHAALLKIIKELKIIGVRNLPTCVRIEYANGDVANILK